MMIEQTKATSSIFISGELQRLTRELEAKISSGDYPTLDEQFGLINKLKESFFKSIRDTHTASIIFKQFDVLNPIKQFNMVRFINWDIAGAYNRIEDIQLGLQTKINKFSTFVRQVEDSIARANGVVQNTAVLNDIGVFETGDSFNDLSRIDTESNNSTAPLFQSRIGGIVTLPRAQSDNIDPAKVIVMSSSNGFVPDGQDIAAISDSNPDTWFEYRRETIDQNDNTKLILDLLIKLKLPTVVNLIRISPLLINEKSFPYIKNISTSLDGRVYQDIRDSLPIFITKEEEDALFTLGPVGFRNQAAAEFVITPRTCQFIKIRIQQAKKTKQANLTFSQVIAIRDINIQQIQYQQRGELVTTALPLPFLAKKVLVTERAAPTSPLTTIDYQVSLDGGASFAPITAGKALEINTGKQGALDIDGQQKEVRLSITAVRNPENFNGIAAPLASTTKTISELIPLGQTPLILPLANLPIQDTLGVFRPSAVIGGDRGTVIHQGGGQDHITIDLPINVIPFTETVKVNGHEWSRVSSFSISDPDATEYTIDYNNSQIKFGDNTRGLVPEGEVRLIVPAEKVIIPDTSPFEIDLDYSHDYNPKNIDVKWTGREKKITEERLNRGATIHKLGSINIVESIRVRETVPKGSTSFTLGHIPLNRNELDFDDTVAFASGTWSANKIIDDPLSPVTVTVGTTTDTEFPGYVEYEAIARILNKRTLYNPEVFTIDELEIYIPSFNSDAFIIEQTFINGENELTQAGDYSIDYANGIAYSFSETSIDGETSINYFYRPKTTLIWEFGKDSKTLVIDDASALMNKNDFTSIIVEKDDVRYFILVKDDRFIWLPFNENYVISPNVTVNTADLSNQQRPLQDTIPYTDFTFTPEDDFIRGSVLTANKTRVKLDHTQIVKNSVNLIHVSDDINSFDDRIVTKDSLLNITITPKPVKDVYGNSLTGSIIGTTTQRDIDKVKLTREVAFINGSNEIKTGGDYSIDYENGILYSFDPVPAHTIIQYEFSNIAVSYIASYELVQGSDFDIDAAKLQVIINSLGNGLDISDGSLLLRYEIIENFSQDPARVLRFYTPILYGYTLKASEG